MNVGHICQHSFITDYLNPNSVVLHCGANHGEFSAWLAQNKRCTVHGFEPDPELFNGSCKSELYGAGEKQVETQRLEAQLDMVRQLRR